MTKQNENKKIRNNKGRASRVGKSNNVGEVKTMDKWNRLDDVRYFSIDLFGLAHRYRRRLDLGVLSLAFDLSDRGAKGPG